MKISPATLLDYLDDALSDRERQRVAAALERDAALRADLAALEELRYGLRSTFDAVHTIPLKGATMSAYPERRPGRWWLAAAPLLALVLLGVWLFSQAGAQPPQPPDTGNDSAPATVLAPAGPSPTWIPGPGTIIPVDPAGPTIVPTVAPLSRRDGTLFVVSDVLKQGSTERIDGYAVAMDLATGDQPSISQASQILPSRDGARWYALRWDGDRTAVAAYEAASGLELWHTPISQTVGYLGGYGPNILALSPDEKVLYVHSYDSGAGEQGPQWLQVLDTATGALAPETIALGSWVDCGAPQFLTPAAGSSIYIKCPTSVKVLDTATSMLSPFTFPVDGFIPQGFAVSPDGMMLYGVQSGPTIARHSLDPQVPHGVLAPNPDLDAMPVDPGLVALSADGSRLVIGHVIEGVPGTDTAAELLVYDTANWAEISRINYPKPIQNTTLAVSADGSAIYAVASRDPQSMRPSEIIVEFDGATGAVRAEHLRPNENILHLQFLP
jgi:DNA-binding beta-propeller fold protein YncE